MGKIKRQKPVYEDTALLYQLLSPDAKIISVNKEWNRLLKYKNSDVIGKSLLEFIEKNERSKLKKFLNNLKKTKEVKKDFFRIIGKDKEKLRSLLISEGIYDQSGKLKSIHSYLIILKKIEEVQKKLEGKEAYLNSIFKAAPVGIGVVVDRILTFANRRLLEMLEYSAEELIGKNARIVYPDDYEYERVGKYKYKDIKKFGIGSIETIWKTKSGKLKNILLSSSPITPKDLFQGVTFTALDITERVKTENEFHFQADLLNEVSESIIAVNNKDNKIIYWNKGSEKMYGWNKDEAIGKNIYNLLFTAEAIEELEQKIKYIKPIDGKYKMDFNLKNKNNNIFPVSASFVYKKDSYGNKIGIGIGFDLSEKKRKEEILKQNEKKFRTLFNTATDAIFVHDLSGEIYDVNIAACRMLGYTKEELFKKTMTNIFKDDYFFKIKTALKASIKNKTIVNEIELVGKRNKKIFAEINSGIIDLNNKTAILSIARDLSERKKVLDELRKSETKNKVLLDTITDLILKVDKRGKILFASFSFVEIFRRIRKDVLGKNIYDFVDDNDKQVLKKCIFNLNTHNIINSCEVRLNFKTEERWFLCSLKLLINEPYIFSEIMIVGREITEQKKFLSVLKSSETNYKNLFNIINEGFILFKVVYGKKPSVFDLKFIKGNPSSERILCIKQEKFINRLLSEVFPEFYSLNKQALKKLLIDSEKINDIYFNALIKKYIHYTAYIPEDGYVAVIFSDISHEVNIKKKLEKEIYINKTIADVSHKIISADYSIKSIAEIIFEASMKLTESTFGYISLINEKLNYNEIIYSNKNIVAKFKELSSAGNKIIMKIKEGKGILNYSLENKKGFYVNNIEDFFSSHSIVRKTAGIDNFFSMPAVSNERLIGQIVLADSCREYSDNDLEVVKKLSDIYALAVSKNEMHRELINAIDKAENANDAKTVFLASVSHELRTPLNGMIGMIGLLKQTKLDFEQKELVSAIDFSSSSLFQIIKDLLDLSKINTGKFEIVPVLFDIRTLIGQIVVYMKPSAEEKGLKFYHSISSELNEFYGDKIRIEQIIVNLISNAVKYTEKGSIKLNLIKEGLDLIVKIEDTGIGIPKDKVNSIFESFHQLEGRDEVSRQGLGLGLAIVKHLVGLMNGSINVDTKLGAGTVFTVKLPIINFKEGSHMDEKKIFEDNNIDTDKQINILIAEDEAINRIFISKLLKKHGFFVKESKNGIEALNIFNSDSFDIVFLDLNMPYLNGFETAAKIRAASKKGKTIPIIALTAYDSQIERNKCKESGMDDIISKPVDENEMLSIIKKYVLKI